jgi:hypothetical protein
VIYIVIYRYIWKISGRLPIVLRSTIRSRAAQMRGQGCCLSALLYSGGHRSGKKSGRFPILLHLGTAQKTKDDLGWFALPSPLALSGGLHRFGKRFGIPPCSIREQNCFLIFSSRTWLDLRSRVDVPGALPGYLVALAMQFHVTLVSDGSLGT